MRATVATCRVVAAVCDKRCGCVRLATRGVLGRHGAERKTSGITAKHAAIPLDAFAAAWLMCVIARRFFIPPNGDADMTLDTLIEILNDYRDEFGGDAEVRLMTQQHWPFENDIRGVTSGEELNTFDG